MAKDGTSFRSAVGIRDYGENTQEVAECHSLQQRNVSGLCAGERMCNQ